MKDKKSGHESEAETHAPVAKAQETMMIQGRPYTVVSHRDNGEVVELENPSKPGEDGKPVTFFFNTRTQQKLARVGDKLTPARGRLPGAKSPRRAGVATRRRGSSSVNLSGQARSILDEYLDLKSGDPEQLVSALVVQHLGAEVSKARDLAERRKKLPADLIDALAGANEETRKSIMAMLHKS